MNARLSFFVLVIAFGTFTLAEIYNERTPDYYTAPSRVEPLTDYYTPQSRSGPLPAYYTPQSRREPVPDYYPTQSRKEGLSDYYPSQPKKEPLSDYYTSETRNEPLPDYYISPSRNEPTAEYYTAQPKKESSPDYYTSEPRNEPLPDYYTPESKNELAYTIPYTYTKDDEFRFQIECQQEYNATTEEMKVLEVHHQMPKTKTQFCLLGCYYKKAGLLDHENYLNYDRVIDDIKDLQESHKDLFKKLTYIVKECIQIIQPSLDECIAAEQYFTCNLVGTSKRQLS